MHVLRYFNQTRVLLEFLLCFQFTNKMTFSELISMSHVSFNKQTCTGWRILWSHISAAVRQPPHHQLLFYPLRCSPPDPPPTTALTCVLRCFPCEPTWAGSPFLHRPPTPPMVRMTRSKTFQAYLPSCHRTYSCIHCRAHLANHDELISKVTGGSSSAVGQRLNSGYLQQLLETGQYLTFRQLIITGWKESTGQREVYLILFFSIF